MATNSILKIVLLAAAATWLSAPSCCGFTVVPSRSPSTWSRTTTILSAKSGRMSCIPIGIGSATPATIVTNSELESVVETEDEWIRSRTGISQRRVLLDQESIRALAIEAATSALTMAGVKAEELDLVIVATSSADDLFGDAPSIAAALGCSTDTVAFDLTAACSGFLFGTVTASKFLQAGSQGKALVVGADALSRWVDWDDRNSCILFGDGAGAMVLSATADTKGSGVLGYAAHSNGHGYADLKLP
jgi:3-oxoacyl-[acyl-carrier-protein] synthase III